MCDDKTLEEILESLEKEYYLELTYYPRENNSKKEANKAGDRLVITDEYLTGKTSVNDRGDGG